jgi:hypothetical protein
LEVGKHATLQYGSVLKAISGKYAFLRRKGLQVREGNLATAEGVSYLETKNLLLLQYCMHLIFYLMLKSEGKPVRQHPVISRLVEIRAYMEKIRPIDKKLHYQIEKLLTTHRAVQVRPTLQSSPSYPSAMEAN